MAKGIKTEIKLDGAKELERFVKELPKRVLKKALRQAVNAGATPIAKDMRRRAPKESGLLKKSVSKKVKTYASGNAVAIIGANRATAGEYEGKRRVPNFYWHLVLGGTKAHDVNGRQHPGAKAQDILTESMRANEAKSARLMEGKLAEVVNKEAAKLASKG